MNNSCFLVFINLNNTVHENLVGMMNLIGAKNCEKMEIKVYIVVSEILLKNTSFNSPSPITTVILSLG